MNPGIVLLIAYASCFWLGYEFGKAEKVEKSKTKRPKYW